jgi:hypothetical protein
MGIKRPFIGVGTPEVVGDRHRHVAVGPKRY